jgi:hypothetical protein
MGEMRIGRSILQPGWRWSESIEGIAEQRRVSVVSAPD